MYTSTLKILVFIALYLSAALVVEDPCQLSVGRENTGLHLRVMHVLDGSVRSTGPNGKVCLCTL